MQRNLKTTAILDYLHGVLNDMCLFSLHSSSVCMSTGYVFFICMYDICVCSDHIINPLKRIPTLAPPTHTENGRLCA